MLHLRDKQRKPVTSESYVKDGSFVVQGKTFPIIMYYSFPRTTILMSSCVYIVRFTRDTLGFVSVGFSIHI